MCETMANFPVEDNSSYILTEDMIDAAMNEQFACQNDIESEEDTSSQDENMEVDQDTQGSIDDDNIESSSTSTTTPCQKSVMKADTTNFNDSPMSVLVIETGLNQSEGENSNKNSDLLSKQVSTGNMYDEAADNRLDKVNISKTSLNLNKSGTGGDESKQPQSDSVRKTILNSDEYRSTENKTKLPILQKILCAKSIRDSNNIESIDLCDSDTDEFSEDETEVELIDDELKSVMESNLMAEVGMAVHMQNGADSNKRSETSQPKIAFKNITQMTSNGLNNTSPNNNYNDSSSSENPSPSSVRCDITNENANKTNTDDVTVNDKNQVPTSIQISKIAVPHTTFVNSQGQKMKCVYVTNSTTLPVVISSNQSSMANKNVKYMLTSQVKKGPVQLSPIAALTNMAKQNLQSPKPLLPKPTKVLSVAPKLQRLPVLQNITPRPLQFNQDQNMDSFINSLICHNLMKPYAPPTESPMTTTYPCLDCSDRFALASSLTQHMARRSVSINYWCRICKAEFQFFNRCVFLKHLRGHNSSLKHIDTTCITFSPIPKEMIDSGIASTYLKECMNSINLSSGESVLQKGNKDRTETEDSTKKYNDRSVFSEKIVSTVDSKKITTVTGQSKSVCYQNVNSVLLNKPINSPAPTTYSSKTAGVPVIIHKKSTLSVVQSLRTQAKDQPPAGKKPVPKSVILLCNNLPKSANLKLNTQRNNIPPKSVGKSILLRKPDNIEVIDDDNCDKTKDNEEQEFDVENLMSENSFDTDDNTAATCVENEKNLATKAKDKKNSVTSSKSLKRYCTECRIACLNISKHLNGSNRPTNHALACKVCHLILPTKCALKIHLRIHMKMAPYKCPDCGKDFISCDDLHAHLKFSCGHLAKCLRFLCVSCKSHFPSISVLGHHISSKHARDIFKCTACPVAFFNKSSLSKHIFTSHPNELVEGMDYKQCSLCPKKLVPMDRFVSHVQEHTNSNNIYIYGYKCPMCTIVFANKMAFIIHQIKEKSEIEGKNGKKVQKKKTFQTRITNQANESNDCSENSVQASDSNSDPDEEPQFIGKYPEPEKDPLSLEDWEYTQQQRVNERREELCIVCKNNSVVLLPGIDLNDQSLCCKQCVKPLDLDDSVVINSKVKNDNKQEARVYMNNLTRHHTDNSKKRKKCSPKNVQRSSSCDKMKAVQKKRRRSDISLNNCFVGSEMNVELLSDFMPNKKRNRKKLNKDKRDQTHIQGQVITSKSVDELVCSKCEFIADTRETFLEHITVHRTDPNTFQCLECGLCFVVLPSLERHLQMHHGIKDVNDYTEKNSSSVPQKGILAEEDTEHNQCRVCYKMFDSGSSLEKHFRTHGMAFMSSLSKSP